VDGRQRRDVVAASRERAATLQAAARAGERAFPGGGAWPERERAALDACRALAVFLANHPTDPVACAIAASLAGSGPGGSG
jgi:hypothetical protein